MSASASTTRRLITIPNVLSALRLAAVPVFLWLFITGRENAAVILFGVGAATDFFDGYIARHFNQVSDVGKVLDPLADRILIVTLAIALVVREALPWGLAIAIVARDVLLLAAYPVVERRGAGQIRVNNVGKTATGFLLVGLTMLALAETSFPFFNGEFVHAVGLVCVLVGTLLYYAAAALYAREAADRIRTADREGVGGP